MEGGRQLGPRGNGDADGSRFWSSSCHEDTGAGKYRFGVLPLAYWCQGLSHQLAGWHQSQDPLNQALSPTGTRPYQQVDTSPRTWSHLPAGGNHCTKQGLAAARPGISPTQSSWLCHSRRAHTPTQGAPPGYITLLTRGGHC